MQPGRCAPRRRARWARCGAPSRWRLCARPWRTRPGGYGATPATRWRATERMGSPRFIGWPSSAAMPTRAKWPSKSCKPRPGTSTAPEGSRVWPDVLVTLANGWPGIVALSYSAAVQVLYLTLGLFAFLDARRENHDQRVADRPSLFEGE